MELDLGRKNAFISKSRSDHFCSLWVIDQFWNFLGSFWDDLRLGLNDIWHSYTDIFLLHFQKNDQFDRQKAWPKCGLKVLSCSVNRHGTYFWPKWYFSYNTMHVKVYWVWPKWLFFAPYSSQSFLSKILSKWMISYEGWKINTLEKLFRPHIWMYIGQSRIPRWRKWLKKVISVLYRPSKSDTKSGLNAFTATSFHH